MLTSQALDVARAPGVTIAAADLTQWDALFSHIAQPHFTQSSCYGEGKRAEGWDVERLVFSGDGQPLALAQVLVKRFAGFPVARINRGPVFLERNPAPEIRDAVLVALRRRYRFLRHGLLLIAPALEAGDESARALRAAGFHARKPFAWGSALIDLTRPAEEIFAQLSKEWRSKVRKAEKLGVTLRVRRDRDAIDWLLERHEENMRDKHFVGPAPGFVRAVVQASPGSFRVAQAMFEGEPVAASLVARFGQHAENFIGWHGEAGRRVAAGNFLKWNIVIEMKAAGCRALDLGGFSVDDRYGKFKRGMNGTEYRLSGEWLAF